MTQNTDSIFSYIFKQKFDLIKKCHICWYNHVLRKVEDSNRSLTFQCNICGEFSTAQLSDIYDREKASCQHCGSNLRYRSIIHILSKKLFGESIPLPEFPKRKDIIGIGMSDWEGYAEGLSQKFSYKNTFYHQEPRLDITTITSRIHNKYDFIIFSDVFEHVMPPVSESFKNLLHILKNGGVCIFTVPFMNYVKTWEHFPGLSDFKVISKGGQKTLINITTEGTKKTYSDLIYHGGEGETLELRIFSRSSLLKDFNNAGFSQVQIHKCNFPNFGIIWPYNWSLPMSLKK